MTNKQFWIWGVAGFIGVSVMGTTIIMVLNGETIVLAVMIASLVLSISGFIIYDEVRKSRTIKHMTYDSESSDRASLAAEKLRNIENAERWLHKADSSVLHSMDIGSCLVYIVTAILFLSIFIPVFRKARENALKRNSIQPTNSVIKTK